LVCTAMPPMRQAKRAIAAHARPCTLDDDWCCFIKSTTSCTIPSSENAICVKEKSIAKWHTSHRLRKIQSFRKPIWKNTWSALNIPLTDHLSRDSAQHDRYILAGLHSPNASCRHPQSVRGLLDSEQESENLVTQSIKRNRLSKLPMNTDATRCACCTHTAWIVYFANLTQLFYGLLQDFHILRMLPHRVQENWSPLKIGCLQNKTHGVVKNITRDQT
jgi:hypothetical protein